MNLSGISNSDCTVLLLACSAYLLWLHLFSPLLQDDKVQLQPWQAPAMSSSHAAQPPLVVCSYSYLAAQRNACLLWLYLCLPLLQDCKFQLFCRLASSSHEFISCCTATTSGVLIHLLCYCLPTHVCCSPCSDYQP